MEKKLYNVSIRIITILCLPLFFCCSHRGRQVTTETPLQAAEAQQQPDKVTVCQLLSEPGKYNHKVIEVTGFISHGFEDFAFFDPNCSSRERVWLEYGGTTASGTIYCCGVTSARTRPEQMVVEDIPIPLVEDDRFHEFDKLIRGDSNVHATLVGRFFSGEQVELPAATRWVGYGHMGMSTLFVIQQVLFVDPHNRVELDYRATAEAPELDKGVTGYRYLITDDRGSEVIGLQLKAETGEREWAFADPRRVAVEALALALKVDESSITGLRQRRRLPGRVIYDWQPGTGKAAYMVVVSRPYWLSFYAHDRQKVAWIAIAAYEASRG